MTYRTVSRCQACHSGDLESLWFLGMFPLCNAYQRAGVSPEPTTHYPLELLWCSACDLVQLSTIVSPELVFPPEYPYASGATPEMREHFDDLAKRYRPRDFENPLIVDIGSNDGTLLGYFNDHVTYPRCIGVTPETIPASVPTVRKFWDPSVARMILAEHGPASVITACNVFAHSPNPGEFLDGVRILLDDDGSFIVEVQHLEALVYDTVYHEHLRYYSFRALRNLLHAHELWIHEAYRIPTHGGSIRVVAKKTRPVDHPEFRERDSLVVVQDAHNMAVRSRYNLLRELDQHGPAIGIGAPSRAGTLVKYCGLDHEHIQCITEVPGSPKIGRLFPGTDIVVVEDSPSVEIETALVLSWHIAETLVPRIRDRCKRVIIPLPKVISQRTS